MNLQVETFALLGCYAAYVRIWFSVFRYRFLVPSSSGNQTSLKAGVNLMGYSVGYIFGGDCFSRKMKERIRLLERGGGVNKGDVQ
jgi:hypothetical protein